MTKLFHRFHVNTVEPDRPMKNHRVIKKEGKYLLINKRRDIVTRMYTDVPSCLAAKFVFLFSSFSLFIYIYI